MSEHVERLSVADLVAKLEAAKEGSRELDEAIAIAVGWRQGPPSWRDLTTWYAPGQSMPHPRAMPPAFSTSLDAALTLVPEGRAFTLWSAENPPRSQPGAAVYSPGAASRMPGMTMYCASTLALALCIACLKARIHE